MKVELHRVVHSYRTWIALAIAVPATLLGLQLYASLNFTSQPPSAWVSLGYSTLYLPPVMPLVATIAAGDWLTGDAATGYLACVILRVGLPAVLWRRSLVTFLSMAVLLTLSVMPAAVISMAAYPTTPAPLIGALQAFPAPEWVFTVANVGTLALAGGAWATVVMVVAPLLLPGRYWVLGAPIALYLLAGVVLPVAFNPMRRADLWFYQPGQGGYWTDAVWWAGWLLIGGMGGSLAWFRKGDLLA